MLVTPSDVIGFATRLAPSFYLDDERVRHAIQNRSSFNLHLIEIGAANLDRDYLRRWADSLGVDGLLDRALEDAGIP